MQIAFHLHACPTFTLVVVVSYSYIAKQLAMHISIQLATINTLKDDALPIHANCTDSMTEFYLHKIAKYGCNHLLYKCCSVVVGHYS